LSSSSRFKATGRAGVQYYYANPMPAFGSLLDDADPPRGWAAFDFNWNRSDSRRNAGDISQFDPIDIKG
jgi:hypothetical protein